MTHYIFYSKSILEVLVNKTQILNMILSFFFLFLENDEYVYGILLIKFYKNLKL